MNSFVIAAIISLAISLLAWITRSKKPTEEASVSYIIKIAIISFVCVYFGMLYFITPVCPDIMMGEPDF